MLKKRMFFLSFLIAACTQTIPKEAVAPLPIVLCPAGSEKSVDLSNYFNSPDVEVHIPATEGLNLVLNSTTNQLTIQTTDQTPAITRIPLMANGQTLDLFVERLQMIPYRFTFKPDHPVKTIVVMGGFNDWSRTALPLSDTDGDGTWERTVYLKPDRLEYKFVVDGEELIDQANPVFVSNNIGGWNSILDLTDKREAPAGQFLKAEAKRNKLSFAFQPPKDGSLPSKIWASFNNHPLHPDQVNPQPNGGVDVVTSGLGTGVLRVVAMDGDGRAVPQNITLLKDGKPLTAADNPDDWHFTVLYNLMIDRFNDANPNNDHPIDDPRLPDLANFHGGDLQGITQKIAQGYFDDLGINTIWISPVQRQPDSAYAEYIEPHRVYSGYHGYWPIKAREVDPRFGTSDDLHNLVNTAHTHDIRVILDFVTNHVHQDHTYFKDHREWFGHVRLPDGTMNIRNWSEETRLTTWFDTFLPSYDYHDNPQAIHQVVSDALWWLRTYNLDGFRQDAVKHVPHVFWKSLTSEMKAEFADKSLYQIGETFGSDDLILSYVNPAELDAQFNFSIYFNARGHFAADSTNFAPLMDVIENNLKVVGPAHLMGNITSSHDQLRFIGLADGQVQFSDDGTARSYNDPPGPVENPSSYKKLAAFHAFNMALPGVPVVYYGDEIGLMGAGDPGNRRQMRFASNWTRDEQNLHDEVGKFAHLRETHSALALGDFIPIKAEGSVLAFLKTYFDDRVLVVFNQSPKAKVVSLKLPVEAKSATNLISGQQTSISGNQVQLEIPVYGAVYYELK